MGASHSAGTSPRVHAQVSRSIRGALWCMRWLGIEPALCGPEEQAPAASCYRGTHAGTVRCCRGPGRASQVFQGSAHNRLLGGAALHGAIDGHLDEGGCSGAGDGSAVGFKKWAVVQMQRAPNTTVGQLAQCIARSSPATPQLMYRLGRLGISAMQLKFCKWEKTGAVSHRVSVCSLPSSQPASASGHAHAVPQATDALQCAPGW